MRTLPRGQASGKRSGFGHNYLLFWIAGLMILLSLSLPILALMRNGQMRWERGFLFLALIWGLPAFFWLTTVWTEFRENRAFEKRLIEKAKQEEETSDSPT